MEYRKARKLSVNRLKRLTGVQKKTFELMVELVKNEEKKGCLGIMVINKTNQRKRQEASYVNCQNW